MSESEGHRQPKSFDRLRAQIDAAPDRRARVEAHKASMLADLRREVDLTQAALAELLDVTQENVSQIERGEADLRLSTLQRYVEALGGHLDIRAVFPERTVELNVGKHSGRQRRSRQADAS